MFKNTNILISFASGKLRPFKKEIMRRTEYALNTIGKKILFEVEGVDIFIYDNPVGTVQNLGIGGLAATNNVLIISLNPQFENFSNILKIHLPKFLAHELHHILRRRVVGIRENLLDALVSEGLAESFECELFSGEVYPWSKSLSEKQFLVILRRAKKELEFNKDIRLKWFLGKVDKNIPKWAGYAIGYRLVQKYIEINGKKASELFNEPSDKFRNIIDKIL